MKHRHEWDEVSENVWVCLMCDTVKMYDCIEGEPDDEEDDE